MNIAEELLETGSVIKKSFVYGQKLGNIVDEFDNLTHRSNDFLPRGSYIIKKSDSHNICLRAIKNPTECFLKTNLLDLTINIYEFLEKTTYFVNQDYLVTNIDSFSDKGPALFWHTDNRKGMLRAILHLNSTDKNSGSFRYINGSHKRDYFVEHKVENSVVKKLEDKIVDYHGNAGDLVIFDAYGFHANYKRLTPRKTVFFEFQPLKNIKYSRSFISIPSYHLTKKVISKINIFKTRPINPKHGTVMVYQSDTPPILIPNISIIKPMIEGIYSGNKKMWHYKFSIINAILFYFFKKYLKKFTT